MRDALLLWEERERRRIEILTAVDQAQVSYGRGEGSRILIALVRTAEQAGLSGGLDG